MQHDKEKKRFPRPAVWAIAVAAGLVIVQALFTIPAPYPWMEAVWGAGDLLTLAGTLVLGYISVSQTQKANEMSARLLVLEENQYKLEICPFVMVTGWTAREIAREEILHPRALYIEIMPCNLTPPVLGLSLTFQNTTAAFLTLAYEGASSSQIQLRCATVNQPNRKLCLKPGEEGKIIFYGPEADIRNLKGKPIEWKFLLENRFADRYRESFRTFILQLAPDGPDGWYCDLVPQDFSVARCDASTGGHTEQQPEE